MNVLIHPMPAERTRLSSSLDLSGSGRHQSRLRYGTQRAGGGRVLFGLPRRIALFDRRPSPTIMACPSASNLPRLNRSHGSSMSAISGRCIDLTGHGRFRTCALRCAVRAAIRHRQVFLELPPYNPPGSIRALARLASLVLFLPVRMQYSCAPREDADARQREHPDQVTADRTVSSGEKPCPPSPPTASR